MDGGEGLVWRRITKGAKAAGAPVAVAVSEGRGWIAVNVRPEIMAKLGWWDGIPLGLEAAERGNEVHLRLTHNVNGGYILRAPPKRGELSRDTYARTINLGRCGGIEASARKPVAVEDFVIGAKELTLLFPRVVADAAGEDVEEEEADDDAPPSPPPPPARFDVARPARAAPTIELSAAVTFALEHAQRAWPTKISRDEQPVKVAAAVALVEFGFENGEVRKALDIEHLLLPQREDMKGHAIRAATGALEALREAAE